MLDLLARWYPQRDDGDWVLGTVIDTRGPVYRKAGALMLFGDKGQQLGLLSGGCLEADIAINARKVATGTGSRVITYDGSDEDDIAYQLGIGCGGSIDILLRVANSANEYCGLATLFSLLGERRAALFCQAISATDDSPPTVVIANGSVPPDGFPAAAVKSPQKYHLAGQDWFLNPIRPAPALFIAGGGVDAEPLAQLSSTLGWHVTVWDPRPANARAEHFPSADRLLSCDVTALADLAEIDVMVIMSHKLSLDAAVLARMVHHSPRYLALLGPVSRRIRVLEMAGIVENDLRVPLAGPAGLYLGGDLPESVALSILAECHAALYDTSAHSLSAVLPRSG